jgi:Family of unknown function (DUF6232)
MSTLSITNRTLTLGSTVYQVSNITSVGKYLIKPSYRFKLRFIIICSLLSWLGIYLVKNNPDNLILKWFTWGVVAFVVLGLLERFTKSKKYRLSIETNSASSRLIESRNEKLIDKIVEKLMEIMNDRDAPASYTFNVADGDIINQSGTFGTGVNKVS